MSLSNGWSCCHSYLLWGTLTLLFLHLITQGVHSETTASTTSSSTNTSTTSSEITTSFNFLIHFPQSAISLVSLACFIGISILVAMLTEKCYERLSLRDDSSDMSEHTKEILKARIVGMVFGKKLNLSKMTEKQRAMELAKKYGHMWQYKAAMRKKRRLHEQKQEEQKKKELKKRRSSLFGLISFGKSSDDNENSSPAKDNSKSEQDHKGLIKKPTVSTITEADIAGDDKKREPAKDEFVSIDMKAPVPTNKAPQTANSKKQDIKESNKVASSEDKTGDVKINMDNISKLNNEDPDEFDIGDVPVKQQQQQKSQKKNTPSQKAAANPATLVSESSMHKYMRTRPPSALSNKMVASTGGTAPGISQVPPRKAVAPLTRQMSRPLTAGGSRPITAGAKRGTTEKDYKSQGKTVRNEVMKKLVP